MSDQERSLVTTKDISPIPVNNRILVLGSRLSGAYKLGEGFQAYLEQRRIPEPSVEVLRNAGLIEKALLGRENIEEGRKSPNLPRGVILLPEMRQYSLQGLGMSLDTHESDISKYVEGFCEDHGIPLVKIKKFKSREQLDEGLKQIMETRGF